MEELDTLRSGARRHEDLVTLFRHQARQCRDLLSDARVVWRDRAAERSWARNIEPQLASTKSGENLLQRQAGHYAETLQSAENAAEQIRAAMTEADAVANNVERALDDARRTGQLAADASREAGAASSAASEALARVQGL